MNLIQSLCTRFFVIALGILCRKKKMLDHHQIEGFEIILFKVLTPCYLFNSIIEHDLKTLLHLPFTFSYLLSFTIIAIITTAAFYNDNLSSKYIKILASGYVNSAIYALPIITFLLKDPLAAILSNLIQVIIIQSFFTMLIGFTIDKNESTVARLKTLISTPLIIMPMLGLTCNYLQLPLNSLIIQVTKILSTGTPSIALFTFGLTLGGISLIRSDFNKQLIMILIIKNIIHPFIAYIIGNYIFHLPLYWLSSLVIISSAPTAYIVYLIAKHFMIEQELTRRVVAFSSVVSLISLVFVFLMLEYN